MHQEDEYCMRWRERWELPKKTKYEKLIGHWAQCTRQDVEPDLQEEEGSQEQTQEDKIVWRNHAEQQHKRLLEGDRRLDIIKHPPLGHDAEIELVATAVIPVATFGNTICRRVPRYGQTRGKYYQFVDEA